MLRNIDTRQLKLLAQTEKSVARTRREWEQGTMRYADDNLTLLWRCARDWDAMDYLRKEHARNLRYKNGDQWSDTVPDPDHPHRTIREDALISRSGKVPLKHNYIQQYIRNIHGQLLSSPTQTVVYARSRDDQPLGEMLTNALQACHQLNRIRKIDINVVEELCLTGIACAKVRYGYWSTKNRTDGKIDLVNINRLFFNADIEDPRLTDIRRIGELHDYTFDDLVRNFATCREDVQALREIYGICHDHTKLENLYENHASRLQNLNFLYTNDLGKYRVIEVWERLGRWVLYVHDYADGTEEIYTDLTMQEVEAINASRIEQGMAAGIAPDTVKLIYAREQYEYYWRVKYLTPNGYCIKETESPYAHEEHPYVLAAMPVIDGRFKAVLSDVIDIQRYINRLLTLLDFIIGASAKGLLMVPQECIPDDMDIQDFAREYVKTNGVILIKKGAYDKLPKQISMNGTNIGAWEMFAQEMNIMQQISGLNGAVQGQVPRANTPSSLYAQQAQNSMMNFVVLFENYNMFCEERDEKLLKVLMQYYTTRRYIGTNGKTAGEMAKFYEPEMAQKIEDFNLTAAKSNDTPVFRQMTDDLLMKLLESGRIPLEIFLNNCSLPGADKLLAEVKSFNEQAAAGQIDPEALTQLQQAAQQNADPNAMAMMQRYMDAN
uniref:portal protein n=1 Tax=Alistipes putredinis TaxID=28117 RepID=UPI0040257998